MYVFRILLIPAAIAALPAFGATALIEALEAKYQIPDYSYAGYHRSEKPIPNIQGPIFDIVDFGAIPNDDKSDRQAIEKAVAAAEKAGGGVVFVPAGRFDLNQPSDAASLKISSSNIVLRGASSKSSVLAMKEALPPPPPMKLWSSPSAIEAGKGKQTKRVSPIVKDAKRGDREIWVESSKGLKAGDWIVLNLLDNAPDFVNSELSGFQVVDKRWTSIINKGVSSAERHEIKSVDGNRLVLTVPIVKPIDSSRKWFVDAYEPLREIGFESLRLEGSWNDIFVHHRSWMDDGGYSMLSLSNVVDSWVRDCVFVNVNRACGISGSAQVSVLDCRIEGVAGHNAINFLASSFCLMARTEDRAGQWHSLGVANESIGNVLWKCFWKSDTCFESHSSQPRHTLIDTCSGGFMAGRGGGAAVNLPTHMEGLVMWNHLKTSPELKDFRFEPLEELYWRVLQPMIVGMHGTKIDFREGQSTVISNGAPLSEGSLYEFQLRRRLGELPEDLRDR